MEVLMSSLIRYTNPMSSLSNWLDDFFGNNFYESFDRQITTTWPRVDITENDANYTIKADLPGMDKKDVSITVENNVLTIVGEKKEEHKKEQGKYYHLERSYGKFARSFALPDEVSANTIEAKMNNGVLELTLPKTERAKPKAIEVKVQ
jgi:HSP20 family protein